MDHKRVIDELMQGKEFAKELKIHLENPSSSNKCQEILIRNILNSYHKSLSLLTTRGLNPISHSHGGLGITKLELQIPLRESPRREDSERQLKDLDQKDLNSKRNSNRNMEKWKNQVQMRGDMGFEEDCDDGYSWRKYGQKDILGPKHPRGYYRCAYRQVEGSLATKQVRKVDKDPNMFDITYCGSHTCNPGTHVDSTLPPPPMSTQRPDIQQPAQQNQFLQSPETFLNFQTGHMVITENLGTHCFSFPSTSKSMFNLPTLNDVYDDQTASGSTYFTMSKPQVSVIGRNPSAIVVESELNDIVSATTSSTNSHNVDVGFRYGELDFGNNFNIFD